MPLDTDALTAELTSLFTSPPTTAVGCAGRWADAMQLFSVNIVPVSTTVTSARDSLEAALASTFENSLDASQTALEMETAFTAFATTVGLGMAPAYTGLPPASPIGFSSLFSQRPTTTEEAVNNFVTAIDPWMRTGTATRTSTPFDTVTWT